MLNKLKVQGFKSLSDVQVEFPRMAVLFGPNAAGKSNLIDAIQAVSRLGTEHTLTDALSDPIRGNPLEAFAFPAQGMEGLLGEDTATFTLEAELGVGKTTYSYRVSARITPKSGALAVEDENLAKLRGPGGVPWGNPSIERVGDDLYIRRKGKGSHPRYEPVGLNHTKLSDRQLSGPGYKAFTDCLHELSGWRTYYLDPRVSMRRESAPREVSDIGILGEDIAPFLHRLQAEESKYYGAVVRALRTLVPSVDSLSVDLDKRRGTLDIMVRQDGVDFSSRIISEGTLRVLALCAIAANPWSGQLLAFEEPENGVHPRRLELVAELLTSLALDQGRQLVVTTHSPLFCQAMLKQARQRPEEIGLFSVSRSEKATVVNRFEATGPLFEDVEIGDGLHSDSEDGRFERLLLRGLIDG